MNTNQELNNRVYAISGAAGGMGLGIARELLDAGARLILTDLKDDTLRKAVNQLNVDENQVILKQGDISNDNLALEIADLAYSAFGRLDGGVCCAGVIFFDPVLELKPQNWDTTMAVNLRGCFFFLQGLARSMIQNKSTGGAFVTISATSANGPRPNNADYGASKAAVEHITRTFALDLAQHKIRVNAVSPGVIPTPMWKKVDRDRGAILGLKEGELTQRMIGMIPLRRIGSTEDIANAVRYLISDNADFITGQVLTVDGGFNLANA